MRFGQSMRLVGDVADAEVRDDDVEIAVGKRQILRVGFDEGCARYAPARHLQHRRRKISAGHRAAARRQCLADIALAAAQIERFGAGPRTGGVQQWPNRLVRGGREQLDVVRRTPGIGPAADFQFLERRVVAHRHPAMERVKLS
jgi:hypothetical protein